MIQTHGRFLAEREGALWPTDLSAASRRAAPAVVSLAEKYGATVYLLYVAVDLCSYFPAYGNYPSGEEVQRFQSWEIEQAKKKLESLCQEDMRACPNIEVRLVTGNAVEEILKAVETHGANMIVMTASDYRTSQAKEAGMSHVVHEVASRSPVAVHIVK